MKKPIGHAALPFGEVPAFMVDLRQREAVAARAAEFLMLTAAGTSEALGARWSEIDLAGGTWTIPAERMKADRPHRVPLSARAVEVLVEMQALRREGDDIMFPGQKRGQPPSNMALLMLLRRMGRDDLTAHGFRSTFRTWVSEKTNFPGELAEAALAHAIPSRVEAAYQRGDLFEKRRALMDAWAGFASRRRQTTR